jgi:NADPH:quinone reductase-like Zn-dependent oxidoreductase
MELMRAVVADRYGPPEVLAVQEIARPAPGEGEILIRVKAAEVNKADCEMRSFKFAVKWFWLPLRIVFGILRPRRKVLGGYFAGEVVSTRSKGSVRFQPGDAVFGCAQLRLGAHAEYMVLPEDYPLAAKPQSLSFAETASLALNALLFLDRAEVESGDAVLIVGGGGSIGLAAIQIAKARGATVTVVDKTAKSEVVQRAGADIFIDYSQESYGDREERYDVVFTMVPGDPFVMGLRVLKPEGRYVMGNPQLANMIRSVITELTSKRKVIFAFAPETSEALDQLKSMVEAGSLRPIVDTVFPMSAVVEAHHRVESEQRNGGIILDLDDSSVQCS